MNEQQLERALAQLKQTTVTPPLITDSDIAAMRRRPFTTWLLLGLLLVMVGSWWLMSSQPHESAESVKRDLGYKATSSTSDAPPTLLPSSPSVMKRSGATTLDPRSILVLSLTDEELAKFGIKMVQDSMEIHFQSIIGGDHVQATVIDKDSTAISTDGYLIGWYSSVGNDHVFDVHNISLTDSSYDASTAVGVLIVDNNDTMYRIMSQQSWITTAQLDNAMHATLRSTNPTIRNLKVPQGSYSALSPEIQLARNTKPILVTRSTGFDQRSVFIEYMPTRETLHKIPERFREIVDRCYSPYHPRTPTARRVPVNDPIKPVTVKKLDGIVGQPFVELSASELLPFGIAIDSVTVINRFLSNTLDPNRCTFQPVQLDGRTNDHTVTLLFSPDSLFQQRDTGFSVVSFGERSFFEEGSYYEVHIRGKQDSIIRGTRRSWGGSRPESFDESDWIREYPNAVELAIRTAKTVLDQRIPIDSLPYYWVRLSSTSIPVSRLLIGVRIPTPWTTSDNWDGVFRRLVHFNWYLPSERVLESLPIYISSFLKPEFEALYSSIEHELTMSEMCALLEKPSAFGLCSITDSTFRIDGIGPIPARESFTVFVHSASHIVASIKLIGDDGRTVLEHANITISQGANQIPIPIANENIPAGAYTVMLTTPEGTRMSRVLVQR